MNRSLALIAGVLPLLMATGAFADTPGAQINGTVQAPVTLPGELGPGNTQQPLFTIGGMPVQVWAPVAPPYDASTNLNNAADPFWNAPE